jgi:pSer/pThr/pTyr-binding forkhead associated (FHA) protein
MSKAGTPSTNVWQVVGGLRIGIWDVGISRIRTPDSGWQLGLRYEDNGVTLEPGNWVLGRARNAALVLGGDTVSRQHATVRLDGAGNLFLRDHSMWGTSFYSETVALGPPVESLSPLPKSTSRRNDGDPTRIATFDFDP